ncbi:MAG: HlyD family type I secretion periplasmic adaptor subunit [Gammaproteobacteria bacterium]|nr:HlyD family type I secretion periplasmic adaptor subunit [Gammaproteobacteria bacterium]
MKFQMQAPPQNWREKVLAFLKRIFETPPKIEENETVDPLKDRAMWIGGSVVTGALLIFVLWGSLAPLAQGVVATGIVEVAGENKTVQHLEGGIVKEMFVREGDTVEAGETLLVLDDTKPRAEQDLLEARYYGALAEIDRLSAELYNREEVQFSREFESLRGDVRIEEIIQAEIDLFKERRTQHAGEIEILNSRVEQLGEKVRGLQARREASEQEQALLEKEVETLESMAEKDLVSDELLTQQRLNLAQTRGQVGQIGAEIAEAQLAIGETRQQVIQLKNDYRTELSTDLTEARNLVFETGDRLFAVRDQVQRTRITSPQKGKVINMQVHTVGGVVPTGQPIMNIVPEDDTLIVEAQVRPTDVDNVQVGQEARLRITPFKQRATPELIGEVILVSADIFTEDNTQLQYYLARIAISESELAKLGDKDIRPGFPVEVTFTGSKRTLVQYLAEPISDAIRRGMKEE